MRITFNSNGLDERQRPPHIDPMDNAFDETPSGMSALVPGQRPGQRLVRGVCRMLRSLDFATLDEVVPQPGLRVDVMALGPKGEIWVIECKSSRVDYTSDRKWQGYLDWCDRFFWAVPADFPQALLPDGAGVILADDFGAEIIAMAPDQPLAVARRKALTLRFARMAAWRHMGLRDPRP